MKQKILLLGATGSIGQSTQNCVRRYPDEFELVGISYYSNEERAQDCVKSFDTIKHVAKTAESIVDMVKTADYDVLVNAIVGCAGFEPTVTALMRGKKVALANKESLVVGGELIDEIIAKHGGSIVPIDSEHSAILQCIYGENRKDVESITITASGGPFRELAASEFANITPERALKHPTWSMGAKITIDSATLMNKGFEVIEAHHLYKIEYDRINVVVHPQSIIHSSVTFIDGAVIAQCGLPDMELPIQYALTFPERKYMIPTPRLDWAKAKQLTFFEPDYDKFPCLRMCYDAGNAGGTLPCVLNAANEVAVAKFLCGEIKFVQIYQMIRRALDYYRRENLESVEQILALDRRIRSEMIDWR